MDKEEFLNGIRERLKDKSKQDHLERINYLKVDDDSEYQELKRDIKKELLLGEFREE